MEIEGGYNDDSKDFSNRSSPAIMQRLFNYEAFIVRFIRKLSLLVVLLMQLTGCHAMSNPTVTLETNQGNIVIELNPEAAPKTVENFLAYAKEGFYDDTIFHRVIPNFMIQGGGFSEDMKQKTTKDPIENEANNGLKNEVGSIAMARTSDPHSATAQFFINVKDNGFLDFTAPTMQGWGYCVFGKVTEGLDVIQKLEKVATGNKAGHQDVPLEAIVIQKTTVAE